MRCRSQCRRHTEPGAKCHIRHSQFRAVPAIKPPYDDNAGRRMADTLIDDVSDTAFWIAHYRGLETERPDALFRDPLAKLLAGDRGKQIAETMPRANFTSWAVVMRTCMIDDFIRFAIAQGVDTVLNLGAGLDTRPY